MNTTQPNPRFQFLIHIGLFIGTLMLFEWFVFTRDFKSLLDCFDGNCRTGSSWSFILVDSHLLPILATCITLAFFKYKTLHHFGIALNKVMVRHLLYGLVLGVSIMVAYYAFADRLGMGSFEWNSADIAWNLSQTQSWGISYHPAFIMLIFVLALGLAQEIFFRGFLFSTMTRFTGGGRGMILSGIIFAIYSQLLPEPDWAFNMYGVKILVAFTAFGLLSCLLALRTRMIWMSIGLNVGLLPLLYYPHLFGYNVHYNYYSDATFILTTICLGLAALIYFRTDWFTKASKLVGHQRTN